MACVYKDYLYLSLGFKLAERANLDKIWRIDLTKISNSPSWERLDYDFFNPDTSRTYFGKDCSNGRLFMYGGYNLSGFKNDLQSLDLGNF